MTELSNILKKSGSDKHNNGYTPVYHSLFKKIRNQKLDFLEIGIGTMFPGVNSSMYGYADPSYKPGASLRAWKEYLPNSNIYGADIQPDTQFSEERIKTFLLDSGNQEEVQRIIGSSGLKFDVILDDGCHEPNVQLATLINFYPYLKEGGYYIIEDIIPNSPIWQEGHMRLISGITDNAYMYAPILKNLNLYNYDKTPILIISKE